MKREYGYSRGCALMWTVAVQLILCGSSVHTTNITNNCKTLSESEQKLLERLKPLTQKNFTVEVKNETSSYSYVFQLCGDVGGVPGAGIIQLDSKKTGTKPTMIGTYDFTEVVGGSDWVMLTYKNVSAYDHCSKPLSHAMVMISCNTKTDAGSLKVLQENQQRANDCIYLFELESSAACPVPESKLSTGSILLIIGFCLLSVYLIGGFLYQRLIVGAKGLEQFPNYAFWVEVGNLTADGCDFVCRSRGSREDASGYREVPTNPLEEEPDERDDHLLPM